MAKILCVLYPDPVDGYPKSYARDDIPTITRYDNGQTVPTPKHIDFLPGQLLGSVSGQNPRSDHPIAVKLIDAMASSQSRSSAAGKG
jgi:hypothetical protein